MNWETLTALLQELVDFRFASYEARSAPAFAGYCRAAEGDLRKSKSPISRTSELPAGISNQGSADAEEYRSLGPGHGKLDPARHFIARASGNSMNGGKNPIHDGDYLLLERSLLKAPVPSPV